MRNIFVILGESGSGKTTLAKGLCTINKNIELLVTSTSRPMRHGEVHRVDYNFLSEEDFCEMINLKKFIEHATFKNWYYGLEADTVLNCQKENMLTVLNPNGFQSLLESLDAKKYKIIPIYIYTHEQIRLKRLLEREQGVDIDEVFRRLFADRIDFATLPQLVLKNNGYIIKNNHTLDSATIELFDIIQECIGE